MPSKQVLRKAKTALRGRKRVAPAAGNTKDAKRKSGNKPDAARGGYAAAAVVLAAALLLMGRYALARWGEYADFQDMRRAVERAGFYDGIVIDGVDVSGMTLDEAIARLAEKDQLRRDSLRVTIECEGRSWTLSADEVDYGSNYQSVARHAFQVGRGGGLEERYAAVNETRREELSYSVNYGYDQELLRASVEAVCEELAVAAKPASVASFDAGDKTFTFTAGQDGWRVDAEELYQQVYSAVRANNGPSTVTAHREKVPASTSVEALMNQYGQVSSALTNASSSANRLTNIRQALSKINGVKVGPGQTFSFNETVGQRTTQRGFQMAGAYENGTSTEAVGGGICQVSTTLFNAAVKANLTVVERSPHSKPVAYVDKGKDAAVDWPGPDLKFRNDTGQPVYIVAYLSSDNRVHVDIYGRKLENGMYIRVEAVTTDTVKPGADQVTYTSDLAKGESRVVSSARYGYKAVAYKIYYSADGRELRREVLCKSAYAAAPAVIEVGK